MTRRIVAGALASLAVLAWSAVRDDSPQAVRYEDAPGWRCDAMGNRRCGTPQRCADRLGVAYTREHGATERLDAFRACVRGGGR